MWQMAFFFLLSTNCHFHLPNIIYKLYHSKYYLFARIWSIASKKMNRLTSLINLYKIDSVDVTLFFLTKLNEMINCLEFCFEIIFCVFIISFCWCGELFRLIFLFINCMCSAYRCYYLSSNSPYAVWQQCCTTGAFFDAIKK